MRETLATASFLASAALIACSVLRDPPGPYVPSRDAPTALDGSENQHRARVVIGACMDWLHDGGARAYSCDVDEALRRDR